MAFFRFLLQLFYTRGVLVGIWFTENVFFLEVIVKCAQTGVLHMVAISELYNEEVDPVKCLKR